MCLLGGAVSTHYKPSSKTNTYLAQSDHTQPSSLKSRHYKPKKVACQKPKTEPLSSKPKSRLEAPTREARSKQNNNSANNAHIAAKPVGTPLNKPPARPLAPKNAHIAAATPGTPLNKPPTRSLSPKKGSSVPLEGAYEMGPHYSSDNVIT